MSRAIKFRQWVPRLRVFTGFWGHNIDPHGAYWIGPCSESESVHEQFTGLKDKNGREIYEGDIIKDQHETGDVCCDRDRFYWAGGSEWGEIDGPSVEVIGNIHQHPELLGTK